MLQKSFWKFFSFKQEKYGFDIKQVFQSKILPWTELIQALSSHEFTVGEGRLECKRYLTGISLDS